MKKETLIEKIRRAKIKDLLQIWKLPIAVLCSVFVKVRTKNLWIVCEDANEARDNGYWFFKYVRLNHKNQPIIYAINRNSPDFQRVSSIGDTVQFGSLKHWILYFASEKKISSQKAGNPNAPIFYSLQVYGIINVKTIFLQHGITINNPVFLHYKSTKIHKFICGAKPEYEYIKETFGYPENSVFYTGFCRFDNLHDMKIDDKLIIIMPTWRSWISGEDYRFKRYENTNDIKNAEYFSRWISFLNNDGLKILNRKYGVKFLFFPHRNMQKYLYLFPKSNDYLEVADGSIYNIGDILKKSALMITDYSSVSFDFFYMKKPVIFYQFDYDKFRKYQYEEGYFDYEKNDLASSFRTENEVIQKIEEIIKNNYNMSESFLQAHREFFELYDTNNSKRVYDIVREA